jgi:glutamate-1-semialdehyde 2,1-aminomutase
MPNATSASTKSLRRSPFAISNGLRPKAHALIPGGCHTYAKGDDQYPILSPGFIAHGFGCRVTDVDGNEFIEYGMGNRAVGLGHAFPDVIQAVATELALGCNFTRPSVVEIEAAECLLDCIPGADMVKFCKDGSDATSGAVKLARAFTGRDIIAICGDQPFFSVDDWFIGTTAMNAGIPEATKQLTVGFKFNDIASVELLFAAHPNQIACVILEASRIDEPDDDFLKKLQTLAHANGALFILDEMITGFRWSVGGAQSVYGITPDLSTFGKALANGFSVSALAGKREFMKLGGLAHTDHPRVFLLSTTHGAETHALRAAIATIQIYKTRPVIQHLHRLGVRLKAEGNALARRHGVADFFRVLGRPSCLVYSTANQDGKPSQVFRTLLLQEMIARGVLMPSLVVSYAHDDAAIDATLEALDGALAVYANALNGDASKFLIGRASQSVYRAYNSRG